MEYSAFSEAPDKFHFWTAISAIAGALRRKVWIDQGYFQWTPNFYIVFVAPPGIVSKSTTASIGMNLLRKIPGITFGPDAVTWQSLVQSLGNSTESIEIDGTFHAMSAVTIVSSEFGTFLNPADREMVDVLVSLWDGQVGTWQKATKTQGNDVIENPWINIIACTTPAWIAGNFPDYMIGGGFTSRTVFVYADKKRRLVAYPKDQLPPEFLEMQTLLIHDLEVISQMKGEFKLSKEATAWGEAWYEKHYESRPAHLDNDRFGGYLARKQTHMHKLAMILSASESDELILQQKHLATANDIITGLEYDMPKVFCNIGSNDMTRIQAELVSYVKLQKKIPTRIAYQQFFNRITNQDFSIVIDSAIKAGYIRMEQQNNEIFLISQEAA